MQYLVSVLSAIYSRTILKLVSPASFFTNLFFTILPGDILYMECLFGQSYGRTYKDQLSSIRRRPEAVFHLNNRLNAPLTLKKLEHFYTHFH